MKLEPLPFAIFDEFGKGCEDRVADHYHAQWQAAIAEQPVVAIVSPLGASVRLQWASVHAAHNTEPGPLYAHPPKEAEPAPQGVQDHIDAPVNMVATKQAEAPTASNEREALREALTLALEYWRHRQQRYKNRHPVWVEKATAALATQQEAQPTGPLSSRLRPNVECAPWVIAEVKELERHNKALIERRQWDVKDIKDYCAMVMELESKLAAQAEPAGGDKEDAELLDWLREECCDLRCISSPTGGDDYDVRWVVIQHHMAKPHEREIGESYTDEPRDAIRAARAAQQATGERG